MIYKYPQYSMRNYRNTSIIYHFDNGYQKGVDKNKLKIRHADSLNADKVKQFHFLFMTNTS